MPAPTQAQVEAMERMSGGPAVLSNGNRHRAAHGVGPGPATCSRHSTRSPARVQFNF